MDNVLQQAHIQFNNETETNNHIHIIFNKYKNIQTQKQTYELRFLPF